MSSLMGNLAERSTPYQILYTTLLIFFAILLILCLVRAIKGPRIADRVVAINMMGTMVMVIIAILAQLLNEGYLVDICLIYAMISFLAVIVLTKVYTGVYLEQKQGVRKMETLEIIRFAAGAICLFIGMLFFIVEIFGVFHLKYVLNRMHAAAMGDTLGISMSLLGLMILSGLNFTTLKMALVIVFLWCASPVSSHLIARLEVTTNEELEDYCEIQKETEEEEKE